MENKTMQYVYECQEKSGEIFTVVLNSKIPTQKILEHYNKDLPSPEREVVKCIFVKEVEKGNWHWCQYCDELVEGSNDEDILCNECRMIFGHTRFSQL